MGLRVQVLVASVGGAGQHAGRGAHVLASGGEVLLWTRSALTVHDHLVCGRVVGRRE